MSDKDLSVSEGRYDGERRNSVREYRKRGQTRTPEPKSNVDLWTTKFGRRSTNGPYRESGGNRLGKQSTE